MNTICCCGARDVLVIARARIGEPGDTKPRDLLIADDPGDGAPRVLHAEETLRGVCTVTDAEVGAEIV